jgi:hypothetical protein
MTSFTARRISLGLAAALALACTPPASSAEKAPWVSKTSAVPIKGGVFEASGVARVPGTNGVLFVDDGTTDAIFWTKIGASGQQAGDAVRVPLGVTVVDPEGVTCDGPHFYVVGSQSKTASGAGLVRFTFDPSSRTVDDVEVIDELEALLRAKSPALDRLAGKSGVNIEGLAWDPERRRLLLGLRAPVDGEDAVVVPVSFASGPFGARGLHVDSLVTLPLRGMGVRAIEYDPDSRAFLVVAGATDKKKRVDFTLWAWDGDDARPALTERATIDRDLKPEGVARVDGALFVTCDVSSYLVLER